MAVSEIDDVAFAFARMRELLAGVPWLLVGVAWFDVVQCSHERGGGQTRDTV